jgi:integrase
MRGHLRKRGKNSWAVVVDLGRDPQTGKRRQKWFAHRTRRDAEAHLAQIVAAMQGGGWTPPAKMLLGDFFDQWLRDYAAGAVGPVTLRNYSDMIRVHLKPGLGYVPLSMLSPQAIQGYLSRKLQDGLSPTSVQTHYRLLHEVLGHAVKWGLLARNPAAMVTAPRRRRFEPHVWDEEQVRLFLAEAKRSSRYYPLYLTAILTGMRAGELAGLRWQDVDLVYGVASVRQTFYRLYGTKAAGRAPQMLFKTPKTAASRRAVALPDAVVAALRDLWADQEGEPPAAGGRLPRPRPGFLPADRQAAAPGQRGPAGLPPGLRAGRGAPDSVPRPPAPPRILPGTRRRAPEGRAGTPGPRDPGLHYAGVYPRPGRPAGSSGVRRGGAPAWAPERRVCRC